MLSCVYKTERLVTYWLRACLCAHVLCVSEELVFRRKVLRSHEAQDKHPVCVWHLIPLTCTQHIKPSWLLWSLCMLPKGGSKTSRGPSGQQRKPSEATSCRDTANVHPLCSLICMLNHYWLVKTSRQNPANFLYSTLQGLKWAEKCKIIKLKWILCSCK